MAHQQRQRSVLTCLAMGNLRACSRQPFARPQQQTTKRGMARLRVVPAHGHRNTTSRRWRSRPWTSAQAAKGVQAWYQRSRWQRERGTRWRHGHGGAEQGAGRARPRSERDASVGDANSSEAERAGGSSEQVVRTRDTCAWMASRAQPTAAVAQAHAAQRAGNADRVVTAPSASLVMCTTFKAARICVRHVPNANLIS